MTITELVWNLLQKNVDFTEDILQKGEWDIRFRICKKHISLTVADIEDTEHKYLRLEVNE